jgi:hypothetical protein
MNDTPRRRESPLTRLPHPLRSTLRLWLRTWRAALAAEDAYERARARGLPRDVAADTAFKALNNDDPPVRLERADGTQRVPTAAPPAARPA